MTGWIVAALLLLAAVLALAVLALSYRLRSATRREAMQALAARRGWALQFTEGKLGRPAVTRLSPRGGPAWQVVARHESTGHLPLRTSRESTEYRAEDPQWPEGLLVVTPPLPELADVDSPAGQALVADYLGPDMASYAPVLRRWPVGGPLTVLATRDPAPRYDLGDIARAFAGHQGTQGDPDHFPVLILAADGLRLRLRREVKRADRMEALVDFAQDLGRIL